VKILQKISSILFTMLIVLLVLLAYGSVDNRWYRVVTVHGNSMSPTLWYGDMIVVTPPAAQVEIGSIVVMRVDGALVTHRLIGYDANNRPVTKGDANEAIDIFANPNLRIIGVHRFRLPGFGYPLLFLSNLIKRI